MFSLARKLPLPLGRYAWTVLLAVGVLASSLTATDAHAGGSRYLTPQFQVSETTNLVYSTAAGRNGAQEQLKLDLYQPVGDTRSRRPAAVWVHGGGFSGGDKAGGPSAQEAAYFASLGYVTVSINYRLLAGGCNGSTVNKECSNAAVAATHDGQAAIRYLRRYHRRYRIDPQRIAIGGESAGAVVATAAGTAAAKDVGHSGNKGFPSRPNAFASLSGGLPEGFPLAAQSAPGILFAGTKDGTVPFSWSVYIVNALKKLHVPATLVTYKGAQHVPWNNKTDIIARTVAFFHKNLHLN